MSSDSDREATSHLVRRVPLSFLLLSLDLPAHAQDALAAENQDSLPLLTIKGEKLPLTWWQASGHVSLLENEDFSQGSSHYDSILGKVAGAYVGNPTQGTYSFRGWNQDNILGYIGTNSNGIIATQINGVPVSVATLRYLPPSLWDVNNVEAWRGPQSVNHGPNALGGAVLFRYQPPDFTLDGRARLELGERGTQRFSFVQNLPVIDDELALRFSYEASRYDGSVKNTVFGDDDWAETSGQRFRFQALWHPGGNQDSTLTLLVEHARSRGNPHGDSNAFGSNTFFDRRNNRNVPVKHPADLWLIALGIETELSNGNVLTSTTGFSDFRLLQDIDLDLGSALPWFVRSATDETHFSQDIHITGGRSGDHSDEKAGGDALHWMLGAYVSSSSYQVGFAGTGLVGFAGIPFANSARERVDTGALYGKLEYQLANHYFLQAGLRVNHEQRTLRTRATVNGSPELKTNASSSHTTVLPTIGIAWRPEEHTTVGLKISRGYRGGGTSYAPILGATQDYDPESAWEAELYARHEVSSQLTLSSSLYYTRLSDMQVPADAPGGIPGIDTLITNSASSHRYGAEVELDWQPADHWHVHAAAAYTHTEFDRLSLNGINRDGQAFPNAPRWSASVGIAYDSGTGVFGDVGFSWAEATHTQTASPTLTRLESRALLNARVGWQTENWKIYIFGENLLNDDYALSRLDFSGLGAGVTGKASEPRLLGIGYELNW